MDMFNRIIYLLNKMKTIMKYITTKKHPDLREGTEITEYSGDSLFNLGGDDIWFSNIILKNWLDKGYIKENERIT